jgi:hypothetical protein
MPAYDLTMRAVICLQIMRLLQQLVDHRVIRINFD